MFTVSSPSEDERPRHNKKSVVRERRKSNVKKSLFKKSAKGGRLGGLENGQVLNVKGSTCDLSNRKGPLQ